MNPKYTHDFSSAFIKHAIEAEFYQKAGEVLRDTFSSSATIVTGPDYQRHIDNFRKNFGDKKLRICEIDPLIYTDIKRGLKCENAKKLWIENKSVELFGSAFIDCDLTCISDIDVIRKTLLKQIDVQSNSGKYKVFIFSFSLRTANSSSPISTLVRNIFGLLGNFVTQVSSKSDNLYKLGGQRLYKKSVRFCMASGRIKDYICYEYNAGGGPMLTCLIIYK